VSDYTVFPKELQRDWLGDLDRRFAAIFFTLLILNVALILILQGIKWREMTQAEVDQYLERVYRVTAPRVETPTQRIVKTLPVGEGEAVTEAPVQQEAPVSEAPSRPGAKRRGSSAEMAAKRAAMQESARSMGIFRVAGSRGGAGGAGTGGTGGSGVSRGLQAGGGLGGIEVGKIAGIATGSAADKVEKARGGLRITTGTGGIDVASLSDADIEEILSASTVQIAALPEIEGLASKNVNRSGSSIRNVADANMALVKNCYNKYKRKDVNLKGKVRVEWSIEPDGSVSKVKILSSEWTRDNLGRRVEDCLQSVISTWLFEPIPPESGRVRASQTYIFD
jgi:outer membrane biosynthesis protein TonB